MPRLLHLNGPPGIGKSTLARRYVVEHPLAFCLDIDGFRRLIGGWQERPEESGQLARRMTLAMAREHLTAGYDVVVPQFVARPDFVAELSELAADVDAAFFEVVLLDDRAASGARFEARATDPDWAHHHGEAARLITASGGFDAMYDALTNVVDRLPEAIVIRTIAGDIDDAYKSLLTAVTV